MAGIFGNGNQGGMGILGAAQQTQPWQSTLGILASALKDATNSFSGNGGDTDNLSKWNATQGQNQIRQQLVAGLTSEDPTQRQQAYGIAPLFGIDPSAFQKQRAAQALPQIMSAMQPQQVTAPGAQADLGQYGKLNVPAANIGTAPGMGFSEALSSVNSPEANAQWATEAIKQQLEMQQKAVRPATLDEKLALGLDAKTPAQVDAFGKIVPVTDPNQITAYQGAELKHQDAVFGETARHNRVSESQAASADEVDPQTVNYWAQSVAAGAPLPALGMGKQAALYRQAILKGAAQINSGKGLTGTDQNVNAATTKANSGALGKQTALRSATEGFENTMLQNMNVARDLLKKGAGTTGIPVLNRYQQYIKGQYGGDPDVVALKNAIDTVADENAKIRSGTLGNTPATDAMRKSIHDGLNTTQTPDQILAAFSVMEKDAGNRSRALRAQEDAIRKGLRGGSDLPQIAGIREPQASGPTPSTANLPRLPAPGAAKIRVFNPATGRLE